LCSLKGYHQVIKADPCKHGTWALNVIVTALFQSFGIISSYVIYMIITSLPAYFSISVVIPPTIFPIINLPIATQTSSPNTSVILYSFFSPFYSPVCYLNSLLVRFYKLLKYLPSSCYCIILYTLFVPLQRIDKEN